MLETHSALGDTLRTLERRLPVRALQTLRGQPEAPSEDILRLLGVTDDTIGSLLLEHGVDVQRLIEAHIASTHTHDALSRAEDVFALVDPGMREEGNPLLEEVRSLVETLTRG